MRYKPVRLCRTGLQLPQKGIARLRRGDIAPTRAFCPL